MAVFGGNLINLWAWRSRYIFSYNGLRSYFVMMLSITPKLIVELLEGNELKGSDLVQFHVLFGHLSGRTEENHEKFEQG